MPVATYHELPFRGTGGGDGGAVSSVDGRTGVVTLDDLYLGRDEVPAGGGVERRTAAVTVSAVAGSGQQQTTVDLAPSYVVIGIETSVPARVRLYPSAAAASADLARPVDQEPDAGAELVMEYVTEAGRLASTVSPSVGGAQIPASPTAHLTVGNLSGAGADVTVTLTYLALEG